MNGRLWRVFTGISGLMVLTASAALCGAQGSEVKEKPPMYSYVASWVIPRSQWGEMEKANAADKAILDKALADGTIIGYGNDETLVHTPDGETHDNWWSATSMAGLMKVLNQFYASPSISSPALASATKHWDGLYVSRYYNWKPGAWKGGYGRIATYKLKPTAPDDAVDTISKNFVVPVLEKLLADGAIREYEVDEEVIHTDSPDYFSIVIVASNPEGLDTVNAAIGSALKSQVFAGPAFDSMTDSSAHRDELVLGEGIYK